MQEPSQKTPESDAAPEVSEAQNYQTEDPRLHTQTAPVGNRAVASGSSWMLWIAGCSLINAICMAANMDMSLALGLLTPAVLSAILATVLKLQGVTLVAVQVIPLALSAGLFFFLSKQANQYRTWALVVGALLMAGDTVICLLDLHMITVAIHVWATFAIIMATRACIQANKLYRAQVAASQGSSASS